MKTVFLLLAQYDGKTAIPMEDVCRDYFRHLSPAKFIRKVGAGEILLPVMRMDASQKAARMVHINDLAAYIDQQRAAAVKEASQLSRRK